MAEAFAVYSADDTSLSFYKRDTVPTAGSIFEGKTATGVYTGVETSQYTASRYCPWGSNKSKITYVKISDNIAPVSTAHWFYGFTNLTSVDLSGLDTGNVTTTFNMFYNCSSLTSLDLSGWDTSNVTTTYNMFCGCSSLTSLDLSGWDTSNVTTMYGTFNKCPSLASLDLSGWDTSNVTNMHYMFYGCSSLASLDLSSWDTSNVTTMYGMFDSCSSLASLDLSGWDTSNVTTMYSMFYHCSSLTSLDLSSWNTGNVTDMVSMFSGCSSLTSLDLCEWNTGNVTATYSMFNGCSGLTSLDLSEWNTSNVTKTGYMFSGCSSLTSLDLCEWNTGNVTNMASMFNGCTALTTIYASELWSTEKVTNSGSMFLNCTALVGVMAYDSSCLTHDYANYDSGYLTYKKSTLIEYRDDFTIRGEILYKIAKAIRKKTESTDAIAVTDMASKIAGITTGGEGTLEKDVNFYDYDGTLLHSYTVEEAQALTELPPLPTQEGLICQGWNYDLDTIKRYNRAVDVGATYITDDGDTRFYLNFEEASTRLSMFFFVNGTATIDWGDGTTPETYTGTSSTSGSFKQNHTYEAAGTYVIRVSVSGELQFYGGSNMPMIFPQGSGQSHVRTALYRVEFGSGVVRLGDQVLFGACGLSYVTIPNNVSSFGTYAFQYSHIESLIIPKGVTELTDQMCLYNSMLRVVSIPDGVTKTGNQSFGYCISLRRACLPETWDPTISKGAIFNSCSALTHVTLPSACDRTVTNMFSNCEQLKNVVLPSSISELGSYTLSGCKRLETITWPENTTSAPAGLLMSCYQLTTLRVPASVTTVGASFCRYCYSLKSVVFEGNVTSIGDYAFDTCPSLTLVDLSKCTTVPTLLGSNAFTASNTYAFKILVPASLLETWKTSSNWSTYASQLIGV